MKNITLIAALLFSGFLFAQEPDVKPVLEKEGDLVKATYFHDNGEIAQKGFYKNGKLHGEWKAYDIEGNKVASGKYDEGKKVGKWFFWTTENLNEVNFENSKIVSVTKWGNARPVVLNK
ncbi:nicotinic acid mononucleotide adenyltransferase [Sinomicrobium kalidii]|uniref:toxin-antitoxin system YwqK family antitoxin n=1 Tax=Sinomicrobium kalidii TaxID=2900738 RepID=UPI001E3770CF|nr:nicotinic acid mononucleotide adenyltransferase [Sinomicrobium kalidii]UGU17256.1 nicotinic acid mononucleotide adenyltransferase [Sinomicrobium kalidii]